MLSYAEMFLRSLSLSRAALERSATSLLQTRSVWVALSLLSSEVLARDFSIALLTPQSGLLKLQGDEIRYAATLALEDAKATLERRGLSVRLVQLDETKPQAALKTTLSKDSSILAVLGGVNPDTANSFSESIAPLNLLLLSPSSTDPVFTSRSLTNVARMVAREDAQGKSAGEFLLSLGAKSVLTLEDSSAYGQTLVTNLKSGLGSRASVVADFRVSQVADLGLIIKAINNLKPDVIFYGGGPPLGTPLLKQLRASGNQAPFVGGNRLSSAAFLKDITKATTGIYYTEILAPLAAYPKAKGFIKAFRNRWKREPSSLAVEAFDAANALLELIVSQPNPTRVGVLTGLRKQELAVGLSGPMVFAANGDRKNVIVYIINLGSDLKPRVTAQFSSKR